MTSMKLGSRGAPVAFLQTALVRAGFLTGPPGAVFDDRMRGAVVAFQRSRGLRVDGIAGPITQGALRRWQLGSVRHSIRRGDSFFSLARRYGSSIPAIETANPGADPLHLRLGSSLTIPLGFDVVPVDIPYSSAVVNACVCGLKARYPFLQTGELGRSVTGEKIPWLSFGAGPRQVLYTAAHHANEWITTPVLLKYVEELCEAHATGGRVFGYEAAVIGKTATLCVAPLINPDGVNLVTGARTEDSWYRDAAAFAGHYPDIPFPSGWKANIRGVDLNLQYPAGWQEARKLKFAQGFTLPGPRDYVGEAPLTAPEALALYAFTRRTNPALVLAFHTQGQVIFWKYLDIEPPGARALGERFVGTSGYELEDVPFASGFAGYKDWFIDEYNRPGYTIEAGIGENPLPIEQFTQIYADNRGILTLAAMDEG